MHISLMAALPLLFYTSMSIAVLVVEELQSHISLLDEDYFDTKWKASYNH